MTQKRRRYSAEFKFKVALEAAKRLKTLNELHHALGRAASWVVVSLRISGNLNLLKERSCDATSTASAKSPGGRHHTEKLWSMQIMGASTDIFFIVTCSDYLCRGVL